MNTATRKTRTLNARAANTRTLHDAFLALARMTASRKPRPTTLLGAAASVTTCVTEADRKEASHRFGGSLAHYAAAKGRLDLATLLVAHGVNVNGRDAAGQTPLHLAVSNRDQKMVEVLVAAGAAVNAQCHDSLSPVSLARETGQKTLAQHMLTMAYQPR